MKPEKKKKKKNSAARKATRRMVAACAGEVILKKPMIVVVSDYVEKSIAQDSPKWIIAGVANYDALACVVAERFALPMAKVNYSLFYGMDDNDVGLEKLVRQSSAGIFGWSDA